MPVNDQDVIAVYLNPQDIARADTAGHPARPHPKLPVGIFLVLLKGGRYAAQAA